MCLTRSLLRGVCLSAVLTLTICLSPAYAQDWTERWFDSQTAQGPSSFEAQRRGYLSGGQFNGRFRMTTDTLFSVTPTRLRAGCGGIDLFAGGLSFLDPEYLVEKFENILQAAPALAFSMALKAHCETCEDVMSKLEGASSFLNAIQVNDCRMSNQVAKLIAGDNPDFFANVLEEATGSRSLEEGWQKHYHGTQQAIRDNNNAPPEDLHDEVSACPTAIRELFADGSVIANAAERVGMGSMASLVRGYIGDVLISWPSNANAPVIRSIDRCPGNDRFSSYDFLTGEVMARPADGGPCVPATNISVVNMVRDNMTEIGTAIRARRRFTPEEIRFINQSAQPVWQIMKNGIVRGAEAQAINAYQWPIAASLSYRIFDDLLTNVDFLINKALTDAITPGVDPGVAARGACNLAIYEPARAKLQRLRGELVDARRVTGRAYRITVAEQHAFAAQAALFEAENQLAWEDYVKGQTER